MSPVRRLCLVVGALLVGPLALAALPNATATLPRAAHRAAGDSTRGLTLVSSTGFARGTGARMTPTVRTPRARITGITTPTAPTVTLPLPATTTTAAPVTTVTTRPAPSAGALSWAPPALDAPRTVNVPAAGGGFKLDPKLDYRIVFPNVPVTGAVAIAGGHHVVVIGGEIRMAALATQALSLKDWTGVMHVEGLRIDPGGDRGLENDAIRVNNAIPGAYAQIQNVWVDRVSGTYETAHGDVMQSWGGPQLVRVDRFTGYTDYQGFYLAPGDFDWHPALEPWLFRNVDLHMVERKGWALFVLSDQGDGAPQPTCSSIYADMGPLGRWGEQTKQTPFMNCGLKQGTPPGGTYVQRDEVGIGYTSPGYG
jgi:hypothetical protein